MRLKIDIGSPNDKRRPNPDKSAQARSLARGHSCSAAADPRDGYARKTAPVGTCEKISRQM